LSGQSYPSAADEIRAGHLRLPAESGIINAALADPKFKARLTD
jgi:hypothetical protein